MNNVEELVYNTISSAGVVGFIALIRNLFSKSDNIVVFCLEGIDSDNGFRRSLQTGQIFVFRRTRTKFYLSSLLPCRVPELE